MQTDEFLKILDQKSSKRVLEWAARLTLKKGLWELSEKIFSRLAGLRSKPQDFEGLAVSLIRQKRFAEAQRALLKALLKIPEPSKLLFRVYKNLGLIAMERGNLPEALERYNCAHAIRPDSRSLLFHRGVLFLKLKNYTKSCSLFQELLRQKRSHSGAWLGLALSWKARDEEELAKASLLRALDFHPHFESALRLKRQWEEKPLSKLRLSFSV